jgi:hypothetical protein
MKSTNNKQNKYTCEYCNGVFSNKQNLNKHIKNSVCRNEEDMSSISTDGNEYVAKNKPSTDTNTEMMILLLRQIEELKTENKNLKNEIEELREENEAYRLREEEYKRDAIDQTTKPYLKDQLYQAVFKFNPFLKKVSMYKSGFYPKDTRGQYVLHSIDNMDYPDTNIKYYKKCFQEILKNIPIDKLPYRVRDINRNIFDIYDYNNNTWIKGKSNELIEHTIKFIASMINSTLTSALSNMSCYCSPDDFKVFYGRRCDMRQFKQIKDSIQMLIINNYSLPEYDMNEEEENIDTFYRRNFINNCFINRIKEIDNENPIEYQSVLDEPVIKKNEPRKQRSRPLLNKVIVIDEPTQPIPLGVGMGNEEDEEYEYEYHESDQESKPDQFRLGSDERPETKIQSLKKSWLDDGEDDGYETDTDPTKNPYFDFPKDLETEEEKKIKKDIEREKERVKKYK